jgi:hypothetical protein
VITLYGYRTRAGRAVAGRQVRGLGICLSSYWGSQTGATEHDGPLLTIGELARRTGVPVRGCVGAVVAPGVSVLLSHASDSWPALGSWAVLALVGIVLWAGAGSLDLTSAAGPSGPATSGLPWRDPLAWRSPRARDKPRNGELDINTKTRNMLLRRARYQGKRAFALMSQRWRAIRHVSADPSQIADIAKSVLVRTQFEHKMIS